VNLNYNSSVKVFTDFLLPFLSTDKFLVGILLIVIVEGLKQTLLRFGAQTKTFLMCIMQHCCVVM
jgi:hypothetical protein